MKSQISRDQIENIYPMSPTQRGMFFHYLMHKESNMYVQLKSFKLSGLVDHNIIEKCISILIERHSMLRTVFLQKNDKYLQIVLKHYELEIESIDISQEVNPESMIQSFFEKEKQIGFDLEHHPALKIWLFKSNQKSSLLVFKSHHVALDGWSMTVLEQELADIYLKLTEGKPINNQNIPQFLDYIDWVTQQDVEKTYSLWKNYLDGYQTPIPLLNKPNTLHNLKEVSLKKIELDENVTNKLRLVSTRLKSTLNIIYQVCWSLLLAKFYHSSDIVVGTVTNGRPQFLTGVDRMIGMFVSIFPVRIKFNSKDTFSKLVKELQQFIISSQDHQYISIRELEDQDNPMTMIRHLFTFDNADIRTDGAQYGILKIENKDNYTRNNFDFNVIISSGKFSRFTVKYNESEYPGHLIENMFDQFKSMINKILINPDDSIVELLTFPNANDLSIIYGRRFALPTASITDYLVGSSSDTPDNNTLIVGNKKITYKEFNKYTDNLAAHLVEKFKVGPGKVVGVYMGPNEFLLIAIVGILKANGAYLPIDTKAPRASKDYIVDDSGIDILITEMEYLFDVSFFHGDLLALDVELNTFSKSSPQKRVINDTNIAYLIYTSGSTGKPKGVQVSDKALLNYVHWLKSSFPLGPEDSSMLLTSHCFDLGYTAIWGCLASGATLHLSSKNYTHDIDELLLYLVKNNISFLKLTPSVLYMIVKCPLLDKLCGELNLKLLYVGGEQIRPKDLQELHVKLPETVIINHYGPTETTIGCITKTINNLHSFSLNPTIGKPIFNTDILLIDEKDQIVPKGYLGEICVGGFPLAKGYKNANLDNGKFVFINSPLAAKNRFYKTGDLGQMDSNGELRYVGRKDDQVKVRGYRIELQGLEQKFNRLDGVRNSAVLLNKDTDGFNYLIAYITLTDDGNLEKIKEQTSAELPEYMIPSKFILLEELPLTKNGKIDKSKLQRYDDTDMTENMEEEVLTALEHKLSQLWKEALKIKQLRKATNFFKAGGNSLKAVKLVNLISKKLNISLQINDVFTYPTIEEQAIHIETGPKIDLYEITKVPTQEFYEVSPMQKMIWMQHYLSTDKNTYNVSKLYKVFGIIDLDLLNKSFQILVSNYEILRTSFISVDGIPKMKIYPDHVSKNMQFVELEDLSSEENNQELAINLANREMLRNFDLSQIPLFKVQLFRVNKAEYYLLFVIHHILSDEQSQAAILKDVALTYNSLKNGDAVQYPDGLQFKDYVSWSAKISEFHFNKESEYWNQVFREEGSHVTWKFNKIPSDEKEGGGMVSFDLGRDLSDKINRLALKNNVSVNSVMLASYFVLIHQIIDGANITILTPISLRNNSQLETLIGPLINTVPIQMNLKNHQSFISVLNNTHSLILKAIEHSNYHVFEHYKKEGQLTNSEGISNVGYTWHNIIEVEKSLFPFTLEPIKRETFKAKTDIWLHVMDYPDKLKIGIEYKIGIFDSVIMNLGECLLELLANVVDDEYLELENIEMDSENFNSPSVIQPNS